MADFLEKFSALLTFRTPLGEVQSAQCRKGGVLMNEAMPTFS
jgi:hypothetical protein